MDKHQKYRLKCTSEGRCPRCGKKCAPFAHCPKHRMVNNIHHGIRAGIKHGILKREDGLISLTHSQSNAIRGSYKIKEGDTRKLPRIKGIPLKGNYLAKIVKRILTRNGMPMTLKEIKNKIGYERLTKYQRIKLSNPNPK